MSSVEVKVPDMGNFDSVTVIDVLVKPGDAIDIDSPLVTLETKRTILARERMQAHIESARRRVFVGR